MSLMMANSPGLLYGRFDSHLIIHDDDDDDDDDDDNDNGKQHTAPLRTFMMIVGKIFLVMMIMTVDICCVELCVSHVSRVAKCQIFYTEENLQIKFSRRKERKSRQFWHEN